MLGDYSNTIRKVTDGVSKTIMFVESAGRPNLYNQSKSLYGTMYDAVNKRSLPGQATGQKTVMIGARPPCGAGNVPIINGPTTEFGPCGARTSQVFAR